MTITLNAEKYQLKSLKVWAGQIHKSKIQARILFKFNKT